MGTNYYWHENQDACPTCGHGGGRVLHIGKSSMGWTFALHIDRMEDIASLDDWKELWKIPGSTIVDEYGYPQTVDAMLQIILDREWQGREHEGEWYAQNQARPGPNGLAARVGCTPGPDNATYDLVAGEFC